MKETSPKPKKEPPKNICKITFDNKAIEMINLKYRECKTINFDAAREQIIKGIQSCADKYCGKNQLDNVVLILGTAFTHRYWFKNLD